MWDLGAPRDRDDFVRRLAVTAAALLVYRLVAHIPIPGLDPHGLALRYGSDQGMAVERISILALGIYPLVSVLILAELAKLCIPALRRWAHANERNRDSLNGWIVLLAIGAAVVQGTGYAGALEGVTQLVAEPGVSFRITCAATIVAGTALVIWLADLITRHGLGSGVWLLFVVPALAGLPHHVAGIGGLLAEASITVSGVLACVAFVVIAVAGIATITGNPQPTEKAVANCLWPLLLSYTLLPWLLVLTGLAVRGGDPNSAAAWVEPGSSLRIAMLAGLLGLFVHLYARAGSTPTPLAPGTSQALVWSVLTAIVVSGEVLSVHFGLPIPVDAENLIVIALVAMLILAAWRAPQRVTQSSGVR